MVQALYRAAGSRYKMKTGAAFLFIFSVVLSLIALTSCGIVSVTYYETYEQISEVDRNLNNEASVNRSDAAAMTSTLPVTDITTTAADTEMAITETASSFTNAAAGEPVGEPTAEESITVVHLTSPISAGSTAAIGIKGKPGTEYSIKVYYKSGASHAEGLVPKISDSNGEVSWSWKVGSRTSAGTFRIVISGDGEKIETYFTVTN